MECQFPYFRQKFWGAAAWHQPDYDEKLPPSPRKLVPSSSQQQLQSNNMTGGNSRVRNKLEGYKLSLGSISATSSTSSSVPVKKTVVPEIQGVKHVLPREGPETETRIRRQHFAAFENDCSEVSPGLFVSGESVAKNREILRQHNITHIINCVGYAYEEYFKDEIEYLTLYLYDSIHEDIMCVIYTAFDFIDAVLKKKGNVLVHCSQGVSRSVAITTGYLMWKTGDSYKTTFERVKSIRGVASPNIGFACALIQWEKKLTGQVSFPVLQRVSPHVEEDPLFIVPKSLPSLPPSLDPRFVYIVQYEGSVYVWEGSDSPEEFRKAAKSIVKQVVKYDKLGYEPKFVKQGEEPEELFSILTNPTGTVTEDGIQVSKQEAFGKELMWYNQARKGDERIHEEKQEKQAQQPQQQQQQQQKQLKLSPKVYDSAHSKEPQVKQQQKQEGKKPMLSLKLPLNSQILNSARNGTAHVSSQEQRQEIVPFVQQPQPQVRTHRQQNLQRYRSATSAREQQHAYLQWYKQEQQHQQPSQQIVIKHDTEPLPDDHEDQIGTPRRAEVEITTLDTERSRKHARNVGTPSTPTAESRKRKGANRLLRIVRGMRR